LTATPGVSGSAARVPFVATGHRFMKISK